MFILIDCDIAVLLLMVEIESSEGVGQRGLWTMEHQHARTGALWSRTSKMGSKDKSRKMLLYFSFYYNRLRIIIIVLLWPDSSTKWFINNLFVLFITSFRGKICTFWVGYNAFNELWYKKLPFWNRNATYITPLVPVNASSTCDCVTQVLINGKYLNI